MKELGKFAIPSVDGDSSKKEQKGSINNPYTIDEYEQLHDQNLFSVDYEKRMINGYSAYYGIGNPFVLTQIRPNMPKL